MKTVLALLSAACLCAHGAAHSQSSNPTAPKATPLTPPATKLPALPAKPGSGQTAALMNAGGGTGNCPIGSDGMPNCEVVIDGKSDGGGWGEGIPNLPADNFGNQAPVQPKILPPPGSSTGEDPKLVKVRQCWAAQDAAQRKTDEAYDRAMARCASTYPDPTGSIGIGGNYAGTGGTITIPADWVSSNPEKRRECQDQAKADKASDTRYNEAVGNSCRSKAVNGG